MFTAVVITLAKTLKKPKCPSTDRWMRQVWYIFKNIACMLTQLCLTLCDPVDSSLPGSSVHRISQARILEWGATAFSRGSS